MESDTPRTDALVDEGGMPYDADFARKLERELAAAKAELVSKADELAAMRQQRDEARREVCSMNETGLRMNESDKKREAKRRGWDCFKRWGGA